MNKSREIDGEDAFPDTRLSDTDAFDRTYEMKDLYSGDFFDNMRQAFRTIAPIDVGVVNSKGEPLCDGDILPKEQVLISTFLATNRLEKKQKFKYGRRLILVFPVLHELEVAGYLLLGLEPSADVGLSSAALDAIGSLMVKMMEYQMISKYKTLLTTRLHSQVVEESYIALQQKAALLEKSEKKYRDLAGDLEKEVDRKTERIKTAHRRLMEQEKLAAVGRLAAGMAHEINNPIGFIKSNLAIMGKYINELCNFAKATDALMGTPSDMADKKTAVGAYQRIVNEIREFRNRMDLDYIVEDAGPVVAESIEGVDRIAKIVSDLKAFSAIDRPGRTLTDINAGMDCVLSVLKNELSQNTTRVKTNYGAVEPVLCRRDQLNQALLNIIINAAEAAGIGGMITITTRMDGDRKEFVEIIIEDTGPGVPPEHLPKIFEPFFTTKTVGEGMGLGLSTAYEMIKNQGGDITVASPSGKGAIFTIKLPAEEVSACRD